MGLFALTCYALAPAAIGYAQETVNQATISGRVLDPQGATVPGATVSVRQTDTNATVQAVTEADGRFRFPYLKIGPYELGAQLQGFKESARTLVLNAGSAFDISIALEMAGIDTAVTVVADSRVLETARSQIAGTVSQGEIRNLPMNGRNFLDLALLVPGVSPTNTNSTQLFAETSGVPGQGLSIASQRNLSNSFIVDGVSANDDAAGLSGITFGVDAIEQFQVVTGGGQAELGRALGGYMNVVTKSGTNALRGSVYGFFRDDNFNGKNALTKTKLPMDQEQFGFSLGGPVRLNRTFFFTNVERKILDQTGVVSITPDNVATINARLQQVGYGGQPVATGIYPNPVHSTNLLGKIDHQFSGADQFTVRYALYDVTSANARGVGNLNAPSGSTGLDNRDQSVAISNVLDALVEHPERNPGANRPRRPAGLLHRPGRTAGLDFGRRHVRHLREQPDQTPEHAVPGGQQRVASSRGTRSARRRRFPLQRRHDHLPALVPRRLYVLVARQLPDGQLQRLRADVRQSGRGPEESERRVLRPGRVARQLEADAQPRASLRPAVARDDQHRHQQRVPARRLRLVADRLTEFPDPGRRGRLLRSRPASRRGECAAVRRQHDRRDAVAPAAGVEPSAHADRGAGIPQHPAGPAAIDQPRIDHDDGQEPAERLLEAGEHRGRAQRWATAGRSASGISTSRARSC